MEELLAGAAAGVLIGVVVGRVRWGRLRVNLPARIRRVWKALKALVQRSVVPVIVLVVFGGALAGLVLLGRAAAEDDKDVWAMITAAVFLLGVSLLLYTTGVKQYTARQRIVLGGGQPEPVEKDAVLTPEQFGRLPEADLGKVSLRWRAESDFTIPGDKVTFDKGHTLDEGEYAALPEAQKSKFEKREADGKYVAKQRVQYSLADRQVAKDAFVEPADVDEHLGLVRANAKLVHVAQEALDLPATDTRVIERGAAVDKKTYRDDLTPEQRATISTQRGLYFRGLYTGADGRWSTSKLQVLLWTYAVLFGLTALFVLSEVLEKTFDVDPGSGKTLGEFGDLALQEQYLLLLGGPFAAAVIAKASTQTKVAEGQVVKTPDTPTAGPVDGLREVISNDAGQTDVMDFQYFFFNILALGIFAVTIVSHLTHGFPELPWFLVGLTSTSALAYATKKSIEHSRPQITGVVPERVRPGEKLEIKGRHLVTPSRRPPEVSLAGRPVPEAGVKVTAGTARDDISTIEITVPTDTKPAAETQLVVVPEGSAVGAERAIEVLGPSITEVQPASIPAVEGTKVRVFGEGFGDAPAGTLSARLGSLRLTHVQGDAWTDTEIELTVGAVSDPGATVTGQVPLRIRIGEVAVAQKTVALAATASSITEVVPSTIGLAPESVVSVIGSGFGDEGEVKVDNWPLEDVAWRDTLIEGKLKVDPVPPGFDTERTLRLLVAPSGRPPVAKDVKVRSAAAATAISDVVPSPIHLSSNGTVVTVVGSGFGGDASKGKVKIDRWELVNLTWTDSMIEGTLSVQPVPPGFDTETTVRLLVIPTGRPPAAKDVKVQG
jgi:IPT/TIG domain